MSRNFRAAVTGGWEVQAAVVSHSSSEEVCQGIGEERRVLDSKGIPKL